MVYTRTTKANPRTTEYWPQRGAKPEKLGDRFWVSCAFLRPIKHWEILPGARELPGL